jgi:hypothetical protein
MAQRRDRPPVDRSGDSLNIRLPDGTMMSMPRPAGRRAVAADVVCCFCGEELGGADPERVGVGVEWSDAGGEHEQRWGAHRACVAARLHERVRGVGPFFDA